MSTKDLRRWSATLALIDVWTRDHRRLAMPRHREVIHRDLPLRLLMMPPLPDDPHGWADPVVIGDIDTLEIVGPFDHAPARLLATGWLDLNAARDVNPDHANALAAGRPVGIGLDTDMVEMDTVSVEVPMQFGLRLHIDTPDVPGLPTYPDQEGYHFTHWRVTGAHIHDRQAWQEATITLDTPVPALPTPGGRVRALLDVLSHRVRAFLRALRAGGGR